MKKFAFISCLALALALIIIPAAPARAIEVAVPNPVALVVDAADAVVDSSPLHCLPWRPTLPACFRLPSCFQFQVPTCFHFEVPECFRFEVPKCFQFRLPECLRFSFRCGS